MLRLLARLCISALSLLFLAEVLPGLSVDSMYTALIVAVIFGIINISVKPLLFILTLPITVLTLGLFALILNGLLFLFVASFVSGFEVEGLFSAILASILLSLLTSVLYRLLDTAHKKNYGETD